MGLKRFNSWNTFQQVSSLAEIMGGDSGDQAPSGISRVLPRDKFLEYGLVVLEVGGAASWALAFSRLRSLGKVSHMVKRGHRYPPSNGQVPRDFTSLQSIQTRTHYQDTLLRERPTTGRPRHD